MVPAELDKFRNRLLQMRDELRDEGDVAIEPTRRAHDVRASDEDEQPLAEMNQAIASSRNRARTEELRKIDKALERMAEAPEDFGLCEGCEEPIPAKRLLLMPWVQLCIDCQSRTEDGRPQTRKNLRDYR